MCEAVCRLYSSHRKLRGGESRGLGHRERRHGGEHEHQHRHLHRDGHPQRHPCLLRRVPLLPDRDQGQQEHQSGQLGSRLSASSRSNRMNVCDL